MALPMVMQTCTSFRRHFYSVRQCLGSLIRFLQTMSASVPTLKVNPVETSRTSGIPAITSSLNVAVKLLLIDHEDFLVTFLEDSIFCGCSTEESF